jgi:hypothetical protein
MAANTAAPSGLEKEQVGTFCFRYFVTQKLDDFLFRVCVCKLSISVFL